MRGRPGAWRSSEAGLRDATAVGEDSEGAVADGCPGSKIFLLQSKFSERATFKIWFVQVEKGDTILDVKKKIAELLEVFPLFLMSQHQRSKSNIP